MTKWARKRWNRRQDAIKEKNPDATIEPFDVTKVNGWEMIQVAGFGDISKLYTVFHPDITTAISKEFNLRTTVLRSVLKTLTLLRNACAHHEPLWNRTWVPMKLPADIKIAANVIEANQDKIYACCVIIHYFLSHLSIDSTWYRRLKKLLNEFDRVDPRVLGFPKDWQSLPYWCTNKFHLVFDVEQIRAGIVDRART